MNTTTRERHTDLLTRTSTAALAASAMMLDAFTDPNVEERLTRAWICGELRRRHPEVEPALDSWAEPLEGGTAPTYVETLIAALPTSALA